jgi:hypothetical protein
MPGITDAIETNRKMQVRETEHQLIVEDTVRNPSASIFLLGGFLAGNDRQDGRGRMQSRRKPLILYPMLARSWTLIR